MTDRQVTAALAASATVAAAAPPIGRSQPWRFVLHTASLDLYADPDGELSREETLLTCGTAVHRARVALARDGLDVRIDLLPDTDPDHVATLTPLGEVGGEGSEGGTPAPAAPDPGASGDLLGSLQPLVDAARSEGARLRLLTRDEAQRLAGATPLLSRTARAGVGRDPTTAYAVLYGDEDSPQAWVYAGQALSALDLAAGRAGLSVVASAAAVELSRSRTVLARMLPPAAHPFAAVRVRG